MVSKILVNCEYQCVIWRLVVVFLLSIVTCGLQFLHKILLRMSQTTNYLYTLTCQYLLLVLKSLNILLNLQMMLQLWKKTINFKIRKNSIVIQMCTYLIHCCENIYTSFVGIFSRTPHPSRYSNKASYSSLNGLALQNPHCPGVPSVGGGEYAYFLKPHI